MIVGFDGMFHADIFSLILLLFSLSNLVPIFYGRPIEKGMNHMLHEERVLLLVRKYLLRLITSREVGLSLKASRYKRKNGPLCRPVYDRNLSQDRKFTYNLTL